MFPEAIASISLRTTLRSLLVYFSWSGDSHFCLSIFCICAYLHTNISCTFIFTIFIALNGLACVDCPVVDPKLSCSGLGHGSLYPLQYYTQLTRNCYCSKTTHFLNCPFKKITLLVHLIQLHVSVFLSN